MNYSPMILNLAQLRWLCKVNGPQSIVWVLRGCWNVSLYFVRSSWTLGSSQWLFAYLQSIWIEPMTSCWWGIFGRVHEFPRRLHRNSWTWLTWRTGHRRCSAQLLSSLATNDQDASSRLCYFRSLVIREPLLSMSTDWVVVSLGLPFYQGWGDESSMSFDSSSSWILTPRPFWLELFLLVTCREHCCCQIEQEGSILLP